MKKSELINFLNILYPFKNCEDWDICGPYKFNKAKDDIEITNILVTLDITKKVIDNAIQNKCNVIISHHPIFYNENDNLSYINKANFALINKMKQNKITHISLHTCFDIDKFGTSYQIFLLLKNKFSIKEFHNDKYLIYFELNKSIKFKYFIKKIKKLRRFTNINYLEPNLNKKIKFLCIGAGSCSAYINDVVKNNCDCFLTGDVKWHGYLDSYNCNLSIVDINHDAENVFMNKIKIDIQSKFNFLNVFINTKSFKIKRI